MIKLKAFSVSLKKRRDTVGIRGAADAIGISPATLSRLENGKIPDLITYAHCCKWLGVSLDSFISKSKTVK